MGKNYFITGSTGFVGRYILRELLKQDDTNQVYLLIRKSGGIHAQQKAEKVIRSLFSVEEEYQAYRRKIKVIEGDMTLSGFGLPESEFLELAQEINIIFHSAASIEYNLSLEEATKINVDGTRHVLDFANKCLENGILERMNHISTAYVVGKQKKTSNNMEFANTYEETKFYAEKLVNEYIDNGLPVTIYRPSIISGDSETGEITINNILYRFIMLFSRNMIPYFPCEPNSSLNIVPINYFVKMMFLISSKPESIGKTYNITNHENIKMHHLVELACTELGVETPQFVPLSQTNMLNSKAREYIEPFLNYIDQSHFFDISKTQVLLNSEFFYCDDIKKSIRNVINFCHNNRLVRIKRKPIEDLALTL